MKTQMVSLEKRLTKSKLKAELYRSKYNRVANRNIYNTNTNNMQPNSLLNLLSKANKSSGNRFSENEKMHALSLWHSSPKCYQLLYKSVTLPSVTTLRKTMKSINLNPGFHKIIFNGLKDRSQIMKDKDKIVLIAYDEMSLKPYLNYNINTDQIDGFQNLGDDSINKYIANYVTVFMIRSLSGSWKQPVGYFFTSGVMNADIIECKLKACIDSIIDCGLIPKLVVSDQGPSNRGCTKNLGITIDKPYFIYKGNTIFFMYDSPHLIKSIRNGLETGYLFKGKKVSMGIIKKFYEIKNRSLYPLATKLTKNHFDLKSFTKMRVNLACQILSNSVAMGIETLCIINNDLGEDAKYTGQFCKFFNDFFDIFNSDNKTNDNIYKNSFVNNETSHTFINEAKIILENIIYCDNKYKKNLPCLNGWKLNVNSLLELYKDEIINKNPFPILLQIYNQDFLEKFFSRIRNRGGNRDNPSPMEFVSDYRALTVDSLFIEIKGSNCILDAGEFLLKINAFRNQLSITTPITRSNNILITNHNLPIISNIDANAIHLLCCNIIKNVYVKFKCDSCLLLLSKPTSSTFSVSSIRVMLDVNIVNYIPSDLFYNYICELLQCFRTNIMNILYDKNIYSNFCKILFENNILFVYCNECIECSVYSISDYVVNLLFLNQIKYLLRKDNVEFKIDVEGRKNRKYLKICHI